jgi:hypothetical protein
MSHVTCKHRLLPALIAGIIRTDVSAEWQAEALAGKWRHGRMMKFGAWAFLAGSAMTIAFHVAMMLGAPWGHLTMGGRWHGVLPLPARGLSAVSAALILLMASAVAARAGLMAWRFPTWSIYAVVAFMILSIAMHVATPSAAERQLWLPVILAMALGAAATLPRR